MSSTLPTYEEWAAASRPMNAASTEGASGDQSNGCALFTGLLVGLLSNVSLVTVVLCQVPQKLPSILRGNVADLVFVLAGIAAAATLALSVGTLVGRSADRNVALSAASCAALCYVLALMNMGDGPLFPIIYLLFALVDAITALVLRKGRNAVTDISPMPYREFLAATNKHMLVAANLGNLVRHIRLVIPNRNGHGFRPSTHRFGRQRLLLATTATTCSSS